ncbi:MAG TPA: hypothetical protein VFT22_12135, partial [Kofleriaceae bacterium]|nr:hypothetical protein [Kofleriaceae bacterium]
DLATVRPHDLERLAPVLHAAARLVEQRRGLDPGATAPDLASAAMMPELAELADSGEPAGELDVLLDELSDREPGALQPIDVFERALEAELERARLHGYSLAVAMFGLDIAPPEPPPGVRGILRARAGNALVNAIRDVDLVTELEHERFLVLLPYSDKVVAADLARRILAAVAAADPVVAAGRTFPPRVIGAIVEARLDEPPALSRLIQDAAQLLEQAAVTGASLAVES